MSLFTKIFLFFFGFMFLGILSNALLDKAPPKVAGQPHAQPSVQSEAQQTAKTDNKQTESASQVETWNYSESEDKMGRGKIRYATIVSDETVDFDFPYQGTQHARITVRRGGQDGLSIFFSIEKGQFGCGIDGCSLKVRFDDGKPFVVHAMPPADNSSETVFLDGESALLSRIKKSKRMQVESTFFQQGSHVFTFRTAGLSM